MSPTYPPTPKTLPTPLPHPKQNLKRVLRKKKTKSFITLRYGDMKKDVTCGRSKWSHSQPRVCKYVRGRATESLLMTHTEKFHSKPYRTDVSYMSSLGPREGSGDHAPIPPKTGGGGVIYCNINSIAVLLRKKQKQKKSTGSAGASGTIPFETHSSILSSLGCTKTTSRRFICWTDPRIPLPSCSSPSSYWLQLPRCAETH